MVSTFNQQRGCIISYGTWYNAGTCATFRTEKLSGVCPSRKQSNADIWKLTWTLDDTFSLKSRKGLCTFEDDTLSCGPNVKVPSEFSVCCEGFLFVSSVLFTNCSTWNRPKMESSPIREIPPSSPTSLPRAKCRARFTRPRKNTPWSLKSPGNPSRRSSYVYSFLQHSGPCISDQKFSSLC